MSAIWLLDTSIYLNVLDVPGFSQHREAVLEQFRERVHARHRFLLPLASIWETGNHIAHVPEGGARYRLAQKFVADVQAALDGKAPYTPTHFPGRDTFAGWLSAFPEFAKRNKSADKSREGTSLADVSLIKEWEQICERSPGWQVGIWSLDADLQGYDRLPRSARGRVGRR